MHAPSRRARAVVSLGLFAGLGWAGTFALFSDEATAESTFSTGQVDLLLENEADDAYAFVGLSMTDMFPGSTSYAPIDVTNAAGPAWRYTITPSAVDGATAGLGDALQVDVVAVTQAVLDSLGLGLLGEVTDDTLCNESVVTAASADPANVVLSDAALSSGAASAARTVAQGGGETLCFVVTLPSTGANELQATSTTGTFTFRAEA